MKLIHPSAIVASTAEIGPGSVVMAGVVVNPNARVSRFCILNTAAGADHDVVLEDGVHICPGARLAGTVTCREDAFVGTGAEIVPGPKIGARAMVGAGAVVLRDVLADSTVIGNPARPVGSVG